MTDDTVECFNCGSPNPEWAQVCRSCGVALRHGQSRVVPTGRVPTDRDSLTSIGAVVGTILVAVAIGLFVSSLNPTDPTVGLQTASPSPSLEESFSPSASAPIASETPVPTPTPVPLRGQIAFGTRLDNSGVVADPTDTFGPGMDFAYSVAVADGFGGTPIENEVARVADDGTESIVLERDPVAVDPAASTFGFVIGETDSFLGRALGGPGTFVWRVYIGEELIAEGRFTYAE